MKLDVPTMEEAKVVVKRVIPSVARKFIPSTPSNQGIQQHLPANDGGQEGNADGDNEDEREESGEAFCFGSPNNAIKDILSLFFKENDWALYKNKSVKCFWQNFRKIEGGSKLYDFMRHIYSVPATTASVERLFSIISNVLTKRKSRLRMEVVKSTCIIKEVSRQAKHLQVMKEKRAAKQIHLIHSTKEVNMKVTVILDMKTGNVETKLYEETADDETLKKFCDKCRAVV